MRRGTLGSVILILIQIIAILLYPLSFFRQYPQSAVLPPILVAIFLLTLVGIYTRLIKPLTGRISMVLTQGINMVMRVVTLFPHLKNEQGEINTLFIFFTLLSIGLSWYSVSQVEKDPYKPPPRQSVSS